MRTASCCFTIFSVITSPAAPVIYSIKFLVFNFLGIDFFAPNNGQDLLYVQFMSCVQGVVSKKDNYR